MGIQTALGMLVIIAFERVAYPQDREMVKSAVMLGKANR